MSDQNQKIKTAACPMCNKPIETKFRPFCSKRCADLDLNRWFSGVYRLEDNESDLDSMQGVDLDENEKL